MNRALGVIEVRGFVPMVEALDACLKSADVRLIGYEKTKGNGQCMLKIEGDVGAVQAAVASGTERAGKFGEVIGHLVISRPSGEMARVFLESQTGREEHSTGSQEHIIEIAERETTFHDALATASHQELVAPAEPPAVLTGAGVFQGEAVDSTEHREASLKEYEPSLDRLADLSLTLEKLTAEVEESIGETHALEKKEHLNEVVTENVRKTPGGGQKASGKKTGARKK